MVRKPLSAEDLQLHTFPSLGQQLKFNEGLQFSVSITTVFCVYILDFHHHSPRIGCYFIFPDLSRPCKHAHIIPSITDR